MVESWVVEARGALEIQTLGRFSRSANHHAETTAVHRWPQPMSGPDHSHTAILATWVETMVPWVPVQAVWVEQLPLSQAVLNTCFPLTPRCSQHNDPRAWHQTVPLSSCLPDFNNSIPISFSPNGKTPFWSKVTLADDLRFSVQLNETKKGDPMLAVALKTFCNLPNLVSICSEVLLSFKGSSSTKILYDNRAWVKKKTRAGLPAAAQTLCEPSSDKALLF